MARTARSGLPTAVYLIIDPEDPKGPCFVGSSNRPKTRYYGHVGAAKKAQIGPRAEWIRKMLAEGRKPELKILGWYDEEKAAKVERETYLKKAAAGGVLNESMPARGGVVVDLDSKTHDGIVKPVGRSSAHVNVPKQWIGKRVRVELLD